MRFLYLFVSLVGKKNELGEVGNEKPSFDAVLNLVYLCQKLLKSDTNVVVVVVVFEATVENVGGIFLTRGVIVP